MTLGVWFTQGLSFSCRHLIQHKQSKACNERQRLEGDLVEREPLTEYKKGDQPSERRELSKHSSALLSLKIGT